MSPTPRVCIIGGSVWGNRGAEAMVTTCIGYLRRRWPQLRVSIFSYLPERDRTLVRTDRIAIIDARPLALVFVLLPFAMACWATKRFGLRIPDALLPEAVRHLRDSQALLDVFGISFADGRELFLPFNVLSLAPAFLLDVPVVKLSQAMGPFHNTLNRIAARFTLSRCAQVFARGEETANHLRSLELTSVNEAVASDLAFLYERTFSLSEENAARVSGLQEKLRQARLHGTGVIAICPSSVVYNKARGRQVDYIGALANIVQRILQNNRDVLVMPHATREGLHTLRNNDLPILDLLKQRCSQTCSESLMKRIHWADFDIGSAGIRDVMQLTDLVITSRFHAMVAALALGIPPLVLGWSHKYREVLRDFALEDSCFDIDALDMDAFTARLEFMIQPAFQDEWRHKDRLATVEAAARRQLDYVTALIAATHP